VSLRSEHVSLASLTTLGVGGPAHVAFADSHDALIQAVREADRAAGEPSQVLLLGGGSNLLISDVGVPGPVVAVRHRGVSSEGDGPVVVCAAAGEPWDDLVAWTTSRGLAGLECLAGIPGLVGATPIQNVGAYGQEVSDTLLDLQAWDRLEQRVVTLGADACRLGYRSSAFKGPWRHRYAVLGVRFALRRGAPCPPRQGELARQIDGLGCAPTPAFVRDLVLALRRTKGMVYDLADPDTHSAGSFFVNPVVSREHAAHIEAGVSVAMPRYPVPRAGVKLAAAWLIEQAGFPRGLTLGRAGLSSRHTLAITNRGGATAAEIIALAADIRAGVQAHFGVALEPEPVLVGVSLAPSTDQGPSLRA
jgi:UDP-N-acetylmuramate dehydrogenase